MQFQAPPTGIYQQPLPQYRPPPSPYAVASQVPLVRNPSPMRVVGGGGSVSGYPGMQMPQGLAMGGGQAGNRAIDFNLKINVNNDGTVTASTGQGQGYSGPQLSQPTFQQFPSQNFGAPIGFPAGGQIMSGPPRMGMMGSPFMPQSLGFPQPTTSLINRPNLSAPQPTKLIIPTEQSTYRPINTKIEEDKIHCVICNTDYLVSEKQQHIRRHQRPRQQGGKIKKLLHEYKQDHVGPQIRPIVQPEQYNVQYNPNSFVLEKVVNYSTPQVHVQPPPPPPARSELGIGTSDMVVSTGIPRVAGGQPQPSLVNAPANISNTFQPETVRLTKDGQQIITTDPNMYNAERMIRESQRSGSLAPSAIVPQQGDTRFSRDTFIADQPMPAAQPQLLQTGRQTIQPQADQSMRVSEAPSMSKLNSPMPEPALQNKTSQKVLLAQDHEHPVDNIRDSKNIYSRQYNSNDFSRPPTMSMTSQQPVPTMVQTSSPPPLAPVPPVPLNTAYDSGQSRVSETPLKLQATNSNNLNASPSFQQSQRVSTVSNNNALPPPVQANPNMAFYGGRSPDDKIIPRQSRLRNTNPNQLPTQTSNIAPPPAQPTDTSRNTASDPNPYFPFSGSVPPIPPAQNASQNMTPLRQTESIDPRGSTVPVSTSVVNQPQTNRMTSISSFNANQQPITGLQGQSQNLSAPSPYNSYNQPSKVSSQQPANTYGQGLDSNIIPRESRMQSTNNINNQPLQQQNSFQDSQALSQNQPPTLRDTTFSRATSNTGFNNNTNTNNFVQQQPLQPQSSLNNNNIEPSRVSSINNNTTTINDPIQQRQTVQQSQVPPPQPAPTTLQQQQTGPVVQPQHSQEIPIADIIGQKNPSYATNQPPSIQQSMTQPQSQPVQQTQPLQPSLSQQSQSFQPPPQPLSTNLNAGGQTSMIETYQPKPEAPLEIIQQQQPGSTTTMEGRRKKLPRFVGGW